MSNLHFQIDPEYFIPMTGAEVEWQLNEAASKMDNNKLDQLAEMQAQREVVRMDHDAKIEALLAPLAAQLAQLNAQRADDLAGFDGAIADLTAEVKADVLAHGETVKGARLMAVWVKGRTSWDSKRLDRYAAAHPEVGAFKTVGEPSVTIRASGK